MRKYSQTRRGASRPFRFYIVSLGCSKNTVDSNGMALLLKRAGYQTATTQSAADVIIVNTCGFVELARQESLDTLRELARTSRSEQRLVAAGCWAQRDPEALITAIPKLDAVLGTRSWSDIVTVVDEICHSREDSVVMLLEDGLVSLPETARVSGYAVSGASAFLKIADGCSRRCAFCAIPAIKGPTVSRVMDAIIYDARQLQKLGVLELNLIAQDTTYYGYDLGMQDGLAQLLARLVSEVPDIAWLRILYAFPGYISPRLIETMACYPQILPYIDIPLQHAHPDVLRRMRRPADVDGVRRTVAQLRERIPGIAIRTTLITGFPGETDAEFQTLLDFIPELRFDRVGVFVYSHEVGTAAGALVDDVPMSVKQSRRDALMVAQQAISLALNESFIGQDLQVLLEGSGDGVTIGRSYRDAPEIDGLILIPHALDSHRFVTVKITEATPYDLIGQVISAPQDLPKL